MSRRPTTAVLLTGLTVLAVAACASDGRQPGAEPSAERGGSTSPSAGVGPSPSAGVGPSARTPGAEESACSPASTVVIVVPGQDAAPACLRTGGTLTIVTPASPYQPWQPMQSTDEAVVRCSSTMSADGAVRATCEALAPGDAIVSTITAAFPGDPHGPKQTIWRLPITVLA